MVRQGFNYEFDALNPDKPPNELNRAFAELFKTPPPITVTLVLKNLVPFMKRFVRGF